SSSVQLRRGELGQGVEKIICLGGGVPRQEIAQYRLQGKIGRRKLCEPSLVRVPGQVESFVEKPGQRGQLILREMHSRTSPGDVSDLAIVGPSHRGGPRYHP